MDKNKYFIWIEDKEFHEVKKAIDIQDNEEERDKILSRNTRKNSDNYYISKSKDKYFSKYSSHSKRRNYNEGNEKIKK